jgi:hypothetical protein
LSPPRCSWSSGIPLSLGYIISALVVIPLVTHGVTFISRFQAWTQPLWLVLQLAPFVFIAMQSLEPVRAWTGYTGLLGATDGSFSIAYFGAASAVLFSLIAQIGEQVDYLRFLPRRRKGEKLKWWLAMLSAGPGWIVIGALKIFAGSFLAFYAFQRGVDFAHAADPVHMYATVFVQMVASPELALGLTGIFVVTCQFKINVTNSYAGSIAWSNFFSRLTHSHPGPRRLAGFQRPDQPAFDGVRHLQGLRPHSRPLFDHGGRLGGRNRLRPRDQQAARLSPRHIEFKRAHLYDINPVGFGAMCIAVAAALFAYFGAFGETLSKLYSYVALVVAFGLVPVIAYVTAESTTSPAPSLRLGGQERSNAASASMNSIPRTWPVARSIPDQSARCAVRWTRVAATCARPTRHSAINCGCFLSATCRPASRNGSVRALHVMSRS